MYRLRSFASVLVLAVAALAGAAVVGGCQRARQIALQRGPDGGALTSMLSPSAPVDLHGVPIVSPTVAMAGPIAPDGKRPTATITVGPQANGDTKGRGKQEGRAQRSANTSTQSSGRTQDLGPEAVAKTAGERLATGAPGSEAAKRTQAVIGAARTGDASKAKELLAGARASASRSLSGEDPSSKSSSDAPSPPSKLSGRRLRRRCGLSSHAAWSPVDRPTLASTSRR